MAAMDDEAAREWADRLRHMPAGGVRALVAELRTPGMPRLRTARHDNLAVEGGRGVAARWSIYPFWAGLGYPGEPMVVLSAATCASWERWRWRRLGTKHLPCAVHRYDAAHTLDMVAADLLERTEAWLRGGARGDERRSERLLPRRRAARGGRHP